MSMTRRLVLSAGVFAVAAGAFAFGRAAPTHTAAAASSHAYVLRMGDRVTVPAIGQVCTLSAEGGSPDLFCARPRHPHHQVTIFKDDILVWTVGNPDRPAWTGKP